MESIRQVADRIVNLTPSSPDKETASNAVAQNIWYLIDDAFALIKNINETSLPGSDRINRIMELKTKYGLPVKNLL